MSKVYIALLAVAGLTISFIGAAFSIAGLAKLFAGAAFSVAVMAAAMEFAKLVVAGFVYRYWGHINLVLRTYLVTALIILMGITSMGIFGYLSNAYQKSSLALKTYKLKLQALEEENNRVLGEIKDVQKFIAEIPRSRISKKFELQKEAEPRIQDLRERSDGILGQIHDLNLEILNTQTKVGPLIYVAEALHSNVDTVAKYLILVFVSVFDPLAVCLIFALSLAIRLREKYRGNENRIAAHALSTPVDHRFRKSRYRLKKAA